MPNKTDTNGTASERTTVNVPLDTKRIINIAHAFTNKRHGDVMAEAMAEWAERHLPGELVSAFNKATHVPAKVAAEK